MNYLQILNRTVNGSLHHGRIGTPVFVRWTASVAKSKETLRPQLAEMIAYTSQWFATNLCQLYATGIESQGHLSVALQYATGNSALLALTLAYNRPHIALAVYGNQGALYHDEFIIPSRDGDLAPLQATSSENEFDQNMVVFKDAIDRSITTQQPIALAQSGVGT